ncbi:aminoglycoside phosphotransferase family protein [Isoptericola sp. NEAU-Y5]|uniref:Aminoglycoside phosphotransferase family protein n=1 Tax=Isoptericola luteus TaxID=2879484 RepID=A0ABS7ZAB3_9MICO|nr:aminoglycoside phosphotransferase family protein [Isoptericola sp. NEAU-Y5]MCA5891998.1 aminoglycoside phosphotransferase family protein [Isoptericola sp. NEAU-Y5]
MLTKTPVSDAQVAAVLDPLGAVREVAPLAGGLFASVLRADLVDGRRVVVKVTGADQARLLRYERGLLGTEVEVNRLAHAAGLPLPRVLLHDATRRHVAGDAMVTTFLDGDLWSELDLDQVGTTRARRSLGAFMARLHSLPVAGRYGYPAPGSGLARDTWPDAFAAMVAAVLDDAARWAVDLPAARLTAAVAAHRDVLATVTTPRLVHADLWAGNLLLDPGTQRVTGVLDAERALWGDPLFELVGADQFSTGAVDPDLLAGYREAGRETGLGDGTPGSGDREAWTRLRLYRAYFACLLVVEVVPRGYPPDQAEWQSGLARANLARLLDELDELDELDPPR